MTMLTVVKSQAIGRPCCGYVNDIQSAPLEAERGTRLLSAMNGQLDSGADGRLHVTAVAMLETMGTAGALVGIGWRVGDPLRVFRLAGFALLQRAGIPSAPLPQTALFLGLAHHLLVAFAWGILLAFALTLRRIVGTVPALVLSTAAFAALQLTELPPILRIGYAVTFDRVQVVAVSVAVALSLALALWATRTVTAASTL